jgi:hypothetical protein
MNDYQAITKEIAHELTKITINTSKVSFEEAQVIIQTCIDDVSDYYEDLGSMESSMGGTYLYSQIGRWLDFMKDMKESSSLKSMRNKSHYFFIGYVTGITEGTLNTLSEQGSI